MPVRVPRLIGAKCVAAFPYSACGCPAQGKVKQGDWSGRTNARPVIFPVHPLGGRVRKLVARARHGSEMESLLRGFAQPIGATFTNGNEVTSLLFSKKGLVFEKILA